MLKVCHTVDCVCLLARGIWCRTDSLIKQTKTTFLFYFLAGMRFFATIDLE